MSSIHNNFILNRVDSLLPQLSIVDSAGQLTQDVENQKNIVGSLSLDSLLTFVHSLSNQNNLYDDRTEFLKQQYSLIDAIMKKGVEEEEKIANLVAVRILQFSSDKNQDPASLFESFYCRDKTFRPSLYVKVLEKLELLFSEKNQLQESKQFLEQSQKFVRVIPFLSKDFKTQREEIKILFSKEMESIENVEKGLKIYQQILSVIKALGISPISSRQEICIPVLCTLMNKKQIDILIDVCRKIYRDDQFGEVIEQLYREIPFNDLSIEQFYNWNKLLWEVFDGQQILKKMPTDEYTPLRFVDALPPLTSFLNRNVEEFCCKTYTYSFSGYEFEDDCLNPEFSTLLSREDIKSGFTNNNVIVELTLPGYLVKVDDIFFQKILDFFELLIRLQKGEKVLERIITLSIFNLILMINPKAPCRYFTREKTIIEQKRTCIIRYRQLVSRLFLIENRHLKDVMPERNAIRAAMTICDRWLEWTDSQLDHKQREALKEKIRANFKTLKSMNYPNDVSNCFSLQDCLNIKNITQALNILPNYILDTKTKLEDSVSIISKKPNSSTRSMKASTTTMGASVSTSNTKKIKKDVERTPAFSSEQSLPQQAYSSFEEWLNKLKNTSSEIFVERLLEEFIQKNSLEMHLKQYFQAVDVLIEQERFYKAIYLLSKILPLQRQGETGLEYNGRLLSIVLAKNSTSDESKTALHRISDPILREEAAVLYRKKRTKLQNELLVKRGIVIEEQASSSHESHLSTPSSSKEMVRSYPMDHLLVDIPNNPSSVEVFRIIEDYAKTKGFVLQKLNQGGSHVSMGLVRNGERMKKAIIVPFHGSEANPKNIKYIKKGLAWVEQQAQENR